MPETLNSKAAAIREHIDAALHHVEGRRDELDEVIAMLQHAALIAEGIEADTDDTPPF